MNMIAPHHEDIAAAVPTPTPAVLNVSGAQRWGDAAALAAADLGSSLRLWRLIWTLSLFDIKLRYRGSVLGPFWLTLSTTIMIAAIGFLYARLFNQRIDHYLPFLTVSLILWNFISTVTADGSTCLVQAEGMIRAVRMPHSLHAARVVMRNILVFAHNLIVIAGVLVIFRIWPAASAVTIIPAALLWCMDGFALSLLLGMLGARFRDTPPIVASLMQIAFYLTPVIWNPAMLMHRGIATVLVQLNPFYSMLEIMRGPLLGAQMEPVAWLVACGYSAGLILLAGVVFARARSRIPYWV